MEGEVGETVTPGAGIIPRMVRQVFNSIAKAEENL
jgi:hypothetical protein